MIKPITLSEIGQAAKSIVDYDEAFKKIEYYAEHGNPIGETTGWSNFDKFFMFPPEGQLNLVTGTPGSGKSEWLDSLAVQAAAIHGYKIFVYSPENFPCDFHIQKICEKFIGSPFTRDFNMHPRATQEERIQAQEFVKERFVIFNSMINISSVDSLIRTLRALIREHNIGMMIIDPWNKLDRRLPAGMDKIDFLGKCLVDLQIEVARACSVHVFIVAHPTKPRKGKDGQWIKPTLYDVSGGAYFFDMIDNGFVCHRSWVDKTSTLEMEVSIEKIKNRFYGKCGECKFTFQPWCGRYVC